MKIATWNVNSLRRRLEQVQKWLTMNPVDVLCLQETKCQDQDFPHEALEALGYQVTFSGQKAYNGVAILTRKAVEEVMTDVPGLEDPDRRILGLSTDDWRILNLYVVNGKAVDDPKYEYKLDWLAKIARHLASEAGRYERYVIVGDFNIAPADEDVAEGWEHELLRSPKEREALRAICATGFEDCYRRFEQEPESFSWWDYRQAAFRRNYGLRIDLILANEAAAQQCVSCQVDKEPRGWKKGAPWLEGPSDHAPVVAEFLPG